MFWFKKRKDKTKARLLNSNVDLTTNSKPDGSIRLDPILSSIMGIDSIPDNSQKNTLGDCKKVTEVEKSNNLDVLDGEDTSIEEVTKKDVSRAKMKSMKMSTRELPSESNVSNTEEEALKREMFAADDESIEGSLVLAKWREARKLRRPGLRYHSMMLLLFIVWMTILLSLFDGQKLEHKVYVKSNFTSNDSQQNLVFEDLDASLGLIHKITSEPSKAKWWNRIIRKNHKHAFKNINDVVVTSKDDSLLIENLSNLLSGMSQVTLVGVHQDHHRKANPMTYQNIHCFKLSSNDFSPTKMLRNKPLVEKGDIATFVSKYQKQPIEIKNLLGEEWKCTMSSSKNKNQHFSDSYSVSVTGLYEKIVEHPIKSTIANVINWVPRKKFLQEDDILANAIFRIL